MESRRILVMNLFSEQQWRCRYIEQTMDKGGGEEGAGEINGECSMEAYTLVHVNRQSMGTCCMTQGNQTGDL